MRKFLTLFTAALILTGIFGCRGKDHPVLYKPGGTKVWPTMNEQEYQTYRDSLTKVELVTSLGNIVIELYSDQAPDSVENFLEYVNSGFYNGTIFHRVEPGMVVQGGGFTTDMNRKTPGDPIPNEAGNGLLNLRGTVGVARTAEMNSGNCQFYINLVDNPGFNGDGVHDGYAVFGRVYDGMDVVDAMALVETGTVRGMSNVPVKPIEILSARVLE